MQNGYKFSWNEIQIHLQNWNDSLKYRIDQEYINYIDVNILYIYLFIYIYTYIIQNQGETVKNWEYQLKLLDWSRIYKLYVLYNYTYNI